MKRAYVVLSLVGLSIAACGGSSFEPSGGAAGSAGQGTGTAGNATGGAAGASTGGKAGGGASGASGNVGVSSGGVSGASGGGGMSPSGSGGAAGASGAAKGGSAGKAGSGGSKPECASKGECPPPMSQCDVPTCLNGQCGVAPAPAGPLGASAQTGGDCQVVGCDGNGQMKLSTDATDVPTDDGNPCTEEVCKGATPTHAVSIAGKACGTAGVCNGTGKCGVCVPGAMRCADNGVSTCDAMGQWGAGVACDGAKPVCSDAKCVAVTSVAAGKDHTCALLGDGTVRCWGLNASGQCGTGATADPVRRPVAPKSTTSAIGLAAGASFTCTRFPKKVECWGANDQGQLGDGTTVGRPLPAAVLGVAATDDLVAGDHHACVVGAGKVRCWGGNDHGQLGATGASYAALAADVPLLVEVTFVSAGFAHACAGAPGKGIYCWGLNDAGQLGRKSTDAESATGMPIVEFGVGYGQKYDEVTGLYAGPAAHHNLATLGVGQVALWGSNGHGEIGYTGAPKFDGAGYFIDQDKSFARLAAGREFNCNLLAGGTVRCNGANDQGQLGHGTVGAFEANVKDVAPLPQGATWVAAGDRHACAVVGGHVYCWGDNTSGQLSGQIASSAVPVAVSW